MQIKLKDAEQIEMFVKITQSLESDVIIGEGNIQVDGKSLMGIMRLDLKKPYKVELRGSKSTDELESFIEQIRPLGILIGE